MMKILFADDDPMIRQAMKSLLTNSGIPFDAAASGDEALKLCAQNAYPLVVSDLEMPGLNGVELARRLREYYPEMTLFAFTGSSGAALANQAAKVFDHVFQKPNDMRALLNAIRKICEQSQPAPV